MSWNDGLTGSAYRIASSDCTPFRVMAGPGTGKTFAMMRRIARLLEGGVVPNRILAVTLTKTAASMLVNELCSIGIPGCANIQASTLHSYCFYLLHKNMVLSYLQRTPRMIKTYLDKKVYKFECAPLIADLQRLRLFGAKKSISKLIRANDAAWATMQSQDPGWPHDHNERLFNQALIGWMQFHDAMLVGELAPLALNFLSNHPNSDEFRRFDYIVVDEYQDLNKAEQKLLDLIATNAKYLIVGDDNQSIYGFRFAHPEGIVGFHSGDANLVDEPLLECRRCGKAIVYAANRVIKCNHPDVTDDILIPKPDNADGLVRAIHWPTRLSEIEGIAAYIDFLVNVKQENLKDVLILCPRRKIAIEIRNNLEIMGISSHSFYQDEILDNKDVQKSITILNLLVNNHDKVSLRYWLGMESTTFHSNQYHKLRGYCETINLHPYDVLDLILCNGNATGLHIPDLLIGYSELKDVLSHCSSLTIGELIDYLFPDTLGWATRIRDLLLEKLEEIASISELSESLDIITQAEEPDDDDYVRIMSYHKSKGLKAKHVIVVGCAEGLMPVFDIDKTGEDLERHFQEQRRVFYVGITRCVERLVLSTFDTVTYKDAQLFGIQMSRNGNTERSRYLDEILCEDIRMISGAEWQANGYGY